MNLATLVVRSVGHDWRQHVGTTLGAAISSTVLVGALVVGDCVRGTLRANAIARIGQVDLAIQSGDRLFRAELAVDLGNALPDVQTAAIIALRGVAASPDGSARANRVSVYGVDHSFFALNPGEATPLVLAEREVAINRALAGQLGASIGDTLVTRVERLSALPRETELARPDDGTMALRVRVSAIVADSHFGRFSLESRQQAPFNMFFSRSFLARELLIDGRANMLLVSGATDPVGVSKTLKRVWQPADAELELREDTDLNIAELRSRRIFLDPAVAEALDQTDQTSLRILTYFVTAIRSDEGLVPYSMVAAIGPGGMDDSETPPGLTSDLLRPSESNGIVLNEWTAARLGVTIGQGVSLEYLAFAEDGRLATKTESLVVTSIVPIDGLAADRNLMPEFPGIATAESSRDWEPGIPIDLGLIGDEDEGYWQAYRGTPKAFIRLDDGQRLWSSRFGNLTAARVPLDQGRDFMHEVLAQLDPRSVGLVFQDVRTSALAGATLANDFGMLFLSLSFFLIFAGVMLTSLLFAFTIQRRSRQIGTLLAIGYRPEIVSRLLTSEAGVLAMIGSVVGGALGLLYTRLVLDALATIWSDAAASTAVEFRVSGVSIAGGVGGATVASVVAAWLAVRGQVGRSSVDLLAARAGGSHVSGGRGSFGLVLGVMSALVGILLGVMAATGDPSQAAPWFFGAGSLLLVSGFFFSRGILIGIGRRQQAHRLSVASLGLRNTVRRRGRSLATISLLACGTFLVVAVGLNRLDARSDAQQRSSGTGGFAFFGTSSVAVTRNLATVDGRRDYGLETPVFDALEFIPMRVRTGDDASCLNLGLAQNPQLVGVDPRSLADRGAFTFIDSEEGAEESSPWLLLGKRLSDGSIPAIGDHQSVKWALHKSVGDTLEYVDERGKTFRVRIVGTVANSILQGNLVVDESQFQEKYPSEAGWRMFLIDGPTAGRRDVAAQLSRQMADVGLELTPAVDRLARFNAVQNTYLSIFQVLGGLGLVLGSAGLGMVVLRNVLEREGELATLAAIGFQPQAIRWLIVSEHGLLLGLGLACGAVSGVVAVLPALGRNGAGTPPLLSTAVIVLGVAITGLVWVLVATWSATRRPLLQALRSE